jgi:adenylate cyclase
MSDPTKAVFLSYASQDAEAAKRIAGSLRAVGVEVWFDVEGGLEHGDEWDAKIRRQIKECVLFLPLISASTQARHEGYFRIEWELAAQRAMGIASSVPFILPIVIDDTREPDALVPDRFRLVQWTRVPAGELAPEVQQRLLKLWSQRIGAEAPEAVVKPVAPPSSQSRPPGFGNSRGLAAIVFTDVVAYSARMQRDEKGTLALVAADFELMRRRCQEHEGEVLNSMGDGLLLCFPSAVQAVTCALQLQSEFGQRRIALPAEQALEHRMGVHIGDVFRQETGGVAGDGVNIAARLEGKAPIGGVCVSQMVYDTVHGKVPMQAVFIGPETFKNITNPIPVWHIAPPEGPALTHPPMPIPRRRWWHRRGIVLGAGGVLVAAVAGILWLWVGRTPVSGEAESAVAAPKQAAVPEAPAKSIAVLPFENMSSNQENAFFADGIHEDLLTNLGAIQDLHVVSRTSVKQYRATTKSIPQIGAELGVAYLLEGSVQRAGDQVRVTGQLIKARNDEHIWARSYDRRLTDVFAIQTELAQEIAGALAATLSPQERELLKNRPTIDAAAYDLFLKARANLNGSASEMTMPQVEEALREALKLDPQFAEAWAYLSFLHVTNYFQELDRSPRQLAEATAAIETAQRLAPEDPVTVEMLGNYYYYGYRDYARAAEAYRRLAKLRPNSSEAYSQLGLLARRQGKWSEALDNLRKATRLDPRNSLHPFLLGETLLSLRRYPEAEIEYRRAVALAPDDLLLGAEANSLGFSARGSTKEMDAWLAKQQATEDNASILLDIRLDWAARCGDWQTASRLAEEKAKNQKEEDWLEEFGRMGDAIAAGDLVAAGKIGTAFTPRLDELLADQPTNSLLWYFRGLVHALAGDNAATLRCAQRLLELVPEASDAVAGPRNSEMSAQLRAWAGDHDGALAEFERLLQTPWGSNVHIARFDIGWYPLHTKPRFEAALKEPKNNAPL